MSKVTWRKEDAEAKKKRLDKEYRDLLNKTFAVMDISRTDASQARYLGIVGSTYRNKKKNSQKCDCNLIHAFHRLHRHPAQVFHRDK